MLQFKVLRLITCTLIIVFLPLFVIADVDSSELCEYIHMTCSINGALLRYDLSENGTVPAPFVDSAWITKATDTTIVLRTYYVQSGEWMDISYLERGPYFLWVQTGECTKTCRFYSRGIIANNQNTNDFKNITPLKILRNGQIYILHSDKTYTLQGTETDY